MTVGINVTKADADFAVGNLARDIHAAFDRAPEVKAWFDRYVDGELQAMGWSATEVAQIRSALNDIAQLKSIYEGGEALANAKDFRTFAKFLYGLGL